MFIGHKVESCVAHTAFGRDMIYNIILYNNNNDNSLNLFSAFLDTQWLSQRLKDTQRLKDVYRYLYIILYYFNIDPGVRNGNNHFSSMLPLTLDCKEWPLIGCYVTSLREWHWLALWELLSPNHKRQKVIVSLFSVKKAENLKYMLLINYIYDPLTIQIHVSSGEILL